MPPSDTPEYPYAGIPAVKIRDFSDAVQSLSVDNGGTSRQIDALMKGSGLFRGVMRMEDIRVLLVDDDACIRKSLPMLLNIRCGIKVVGVAANGKEGLRLVDELKPDVALVDEQMPGMDGIELTRQIKRKNALIRVVVLSVYDHSRKEACRAGADAFLLKDCGRTKLVDTIHALVAGTARFEDRSEGV